MMGLIFHLIAQPLVHVGQSQQAAVSFYVRSVAEQSTWDFHCQSFHKTIKKIACPTRETCVYSAHTFCVPQNIKVKSKLPKETEMEIKITNMMTVDDINFDLNCSFHG